MKVLRIKGFCYRLTNVKQHDGKIKKNNVNDLDLSLHNKF